MDKLNVSVCSETGMCSIIRSGTEKVDLLPTEVEALRAAQGDASEIRKIISECDSSFADKLAASDIDEIAKSVSA